MESTITILAKTNARHSHLHFGIKQPDRLSHTYIIGKTGTGKSTLISNLVRQDLDQGHGLCLIDPHGDLVEHIQKNVPPHRRDDIRYFNVPDRTQPYGYNALRFVKEENAHLRPLACST